MSYMEETKSIQRSVRMTPRVYKAVENYERGDGFNEKFANMVYDLVERRDVIKLDWERLQAAVNDKRAELKAIQEKIRKIRTLDARLAPLVDAILDLIKEP